MKNKFLAKLQKHWQILTFTFFAVGAIFTFYSWRAEAVTAAEQVVEVQQKVIKFEDTFNNIAQISKDLQDPNLWLKNYLVNHGKDTASARIWSQFPKGPVVDTLGRSLANIPFLDPQFLPERGIYKLIRGDGNEIVLDTLWNFIIKE